MKTNFKSQERNNAQKTSLNVFAIIISLVILSITVDAQGIWKSFIEMSNANKNDLVMVNSTENLTTENEANVFTTSSYAVYSEQETEESLELEEWMTNDAYFSTSTIMEEETEKPLELEAWMTNESLFAVNTAFGTETEDALELEDWMTDENYFSQSTIQFVEETENALELEDWMLNERYFQPTKNEEQPLALENWMIAENYWNN
jgi:hypothetical protein